jgi:ubiquinone/menaquinone biosynthesis C-methylase UbiE
MDVVEVGCGDGRMTWRYAVLTKSVLGLDPNRELINEAREGTPNALKATVTFLAGDVASLALPERQSDVTPVF